MRCPVLRSIVFLTLALAARSPAQDAPPRPPIMRLDDFEAEPKGWKFVGGEEFPGAKGSLARDATRAHGGKASYKLDANFEGGGAYVGNHPAAKHKKASLWIDDLSAVGITPGMPTLREASVSPASTRPGLTCRSKSRPPLRTSRCS